MARLDWLISPFSGPGNSLGMVFCIAKLDTLLPDIFSPFGSLVFATMSLHSCYECAPVGQLGTLSAGNIFSRNPNCPIGSNGGGRIIAPTHSASPTVRAITAETILWRAAFSNNMNDASYAAVLYIDVCKAREIIGANQIEG